MKVDSIKKSLVAGIVLGSCVFLVYTLFTCFIYYLLNGENFVYKGEIRNVINGISFDAVKIVAVVISTVIPIMLVRYKKITHYIFTILIAVVLYIAYFSAYLVALSYVPIEMAINFPMNSFDAFIYGLVNFPLGAIIGIIINVGVNFLINRKQ